jgi:hypothetical protein
LGCNRCDWEYRKKTKKGRKKEGKQEEQGKGKIKQETA